ncbi:SMI1/KNR4 family protein [Streptomyces sp. NBC_01142]|uniref:SMI1/KNR4 family protein n=1 Tax=Streptomyces sp. NBC_01142 TaxID=2975865 RepID=UPI0022531AD7|nr:SMI1/KNR4 family protein [Streptomyces sp. NBC_01142]MCX4821837.1 SMI1/KNR4 family protein [Streptomyces sp. NBC_01142]
MSSQERPRHFYYETPGVPLPEEPEPELVLDPATEVIEARQVTEAWQRIETWLREHAPASHATLRPGASEGQISAVLSAVTGPVPAALQALWRLRDGVVRDAGREVFLMDNWALLPTEGAIEEYRFRRKDGDDYWKPHWTPFASWAADYRRYGLFLDADSGEVWSWGDGDRRPKYESLTVYLEETADALEVPHLLDGYRPGLAHGGLTWGHPDDPPEGWVPFPKVPRRQSVRASRQPPK